MKTKRVPEDADLLFARGEGHFKFLVWRRRRSGAIVASCVGRLWEGSWDDESDPLPSLLEGKNFLLALRPAKLVWDLGQLDSISSAALARLEQCRDCLRAQGCEIATLAGGRLRAA